MSNPDLLALALKHGAYVQPERDKYDAPTGRKCVEFHEEELIAFVAALEASQSQPMGVPAGMKLVPIEPTQKMLQCFGHEYAVSGTAKKCYAAMLSAAPSLPADEKVHPCDHVWVSAKNEAVLNGSICRFCLEIDAREPGALNAASPSSKVELPVVAWMTEESQTTPVVTDSFLKWKTEFKNVYQIPLVRLSDVQLILANQGENK